MLFRSVDSLSFQAVLKHVVFNQFFNTLVRGANNKMDETQPLNVKIMEKTFERLIKREKKGLVEEESSRTCCYDKIFENEMLQNLADEAIEAGGFDFSHLKNMDAMLAKETDAKKLDLFEQNGLVAFFGYVLN